MDLGDPEVQDVAPTCPPQLQMATADLSGVQGLGTTCTHTCVGWAGSLPQPCLEHAEQFQCGSQASLLLGI